MATTKQLNDILDEIADGPAIRFAALVSRDGFLVGNSSSTTEADQLAISRLVQMLTVADGVGEDLQEGNTKQIVVKYQNGLVVVDCLDSDALLVTAVASEASVAWVKYAVRKNLSEINQKV